MAQRKYTKKEDASLEQSWHKYSVRSTSMAKLNEEMIVIKISELLKDSDESRQILDAEMCASLEAVIQELAGAGKLVELIRDAQ